MSVKEVIEIDNLKMSDLRDIVNRHNHIPDDAPLLLVQELWDEDYPIQEFHSLGMVVARNGSVMLFVKSAGT